MAAILIHQFRVGESNYNYILYHSDSKAAVVIDPLESGPVLYQVKRLGLRVKAILNTHGHPDHIAGNEGVQKETGAPIVAGEHESIPGVSQKLKDGEVFAVDGIEMKVIHTPGHTSGHISLVVYDRYFIVGDTLFLGGCGNCRFGGDPDQLFDSLQKMVQQSDALEIYCGHEYTQKNLEFCQMHDPENDTLRKWQKQIDEKLRAGQTPSSTLGNEKQVNVFLRSGEPQVYRHLKQKFADLPQDPRAVFKKLRQLRNSF